MSNRSRTAPLPLLLALVCGPLSAHAAVTWRPDELAPALTEARQHNRLVLVDFGASWCVPCQTMDALVWSRADVETAVRERFVPVRADPDTATGGALGARYHVSGLPALLVLDASGAEVDRFVGETDGETMLALLRAWGQGRSSFDALQARLAQNPGDVALRFEVASRFANRGDAPHARPLLEQIAHVDDRDNRRTFAAQALYLLGDRVSLALEHNPAGAVAALTELVQRFGTTTSASRASFPLGRALHALHRDGEALPHLERYLAPTLPTAAAHARALGEWMLAERWELPRAEGWLRSVLPRAPRDAGLVGVLADVVDAQPSRRPEALVLARRALALAPNSSAEQQRVARLSAAH